MLLPRGILMHLRPYHLRPQGVKNGGSGLVRRPSGLPSIAAAPCAAVNRRCGPIPDSCNATDSLEERGLCVVACVGLTDQPRRVQKYWIATSSAGCTAGGNCMRETNEDPSSTRSASVASGSFDIPAVAEAGNGPCAKQPSADLVPSQF
jgi:hypothetical protein